MIQHNTHKSEKAPVIRKLSKDIIHRIAAGEVVDRPASLLKELIENSIDAKSTKIKVSLVHGGIKEIIVEDDGLGMGPKDLELCLERHATSKISHIEDLDQIFSLGFRGEALAAISSVSKINIQSIQRSQQEAWQLVSEGGLNTEIKPCSRVSGTKIIVKDLFYNIPARKKFLKSLNLESKECIRVLENLALLHSEIEFSWYLVSEDGEVKNSCELKSSTIEERFRSLSQSFYSRELKLLNDRDFLFHNFLEQPSLGVQSLEYWAMKPPFMTKLSRGIKLYVNGRFIEDKRVLYSIREAYSGLIEVGYFPIVCVHLTIDPSEIDVNIHPQKKEVRWPKDMSVAGLIHRTIKKDLLNSFQPKATVLEPVQNSLLNYSKDIQGPHAPETIYQKSTGSLTQSFQDFQKEEQQLKQVVLPVSESPVPTAQFKFSELRVVGEAGASWLLAEHEKGLILIDQHAAHERIMFEKIKQQYDSSLNKSRPLLFPIELKLSSFEGEIKKVLVQLGFEFEEGELCSIVAVPQTLSKMNWEKVFDDLRSQLENKKNEDSFVTRFKNEICAKMACHNSIRRGQRMNREEIKVLFSQLDEVSWGGFCPHGRPVWKLLSHFEIEGMFHR